MISLSCTDSQRQHGKLRLQITHLNENLLRQLVQSIAQVVLILFPLLYFLVHLIASLILFGHIRDLQLQIEQLLVKHIDKCAELVFQALLHQLLQSSLKFSLDFQQFGLLLYFALL